MDKAEDIFKIIEAGGEKDQDLEKRIKYKKIDIENREKKLEEAQKRKKSEKAVNELEKRRGHKTKQMKKWISWITKVSIN